MLPPSRAQQDVQALEAAYEGGRLLVHACQARARLLQREALGRVRPPLVQHVVAHLRHTPRCQAAQQPKP